MYNKTCTRHILRFVLSFTNVIHVFSCWKNSLKITSPSLLVSVCSCWIIGEMWYNTHHLSVKNLIRCIPVNLCRWYDTHITCWSITFLCEIWVFLLISLPEGSHGKYRKVQIDAEEINKINKISHDSDVFSLHTSSLFRRPCNMY